MRKVELTLTDDLFETIRQSAIAAGFVIGPDKRAHVQGYLLACEAERREREWQAETLAGLESAITAKE